MLICLIVGADQPKTVNKSNESETKLFIQQADRPKRKSNPPVRLLPREVIDAQVEYQMNQPRFSAYWLVIQCIHNYLL